MYIWLSPLSPFCCPRDVSSAGLVIANHQDIKSEIETRADSFTACIEMGNTLINNNHYAADEVSYTGSLSLLSAVIFMYINKQWCWVKKEHYDHVLSLNAGLFMCPLSLWFTDSGKTGSTPGKERQDQQKMARQDGPFTNWYECITCFRVCIRAHSI